MTKKFLTLNAIALSLLMSNTALTSARDSSYESDDGDPNSAMTPRQRLGNDDGWLKLEIIPGQFDDPKKYRRENELNGSKAEKEEELKRLQAEAATFDKSGKVRLSWDQASHRTEVYERIAKLEGALAAQKSVAYLR